MLSLLLRNKVIKATNLEEIIKYFDCQKALTPVNAEEWESFYTEMYRKSK